MRLLLAEWGASPDLQLAGFCHACYGTDGFSTALLRLDERSVLADAVGSGVEAMVYHYASCDRDALYPQFGRDRITFRDRFTGAERVIDAPQLDAFVELTAANELDVIRNDAHLAERYGGDLAALFAAAEARLSPQARAAWRSALVPER